MLPLLEMICTVLKKKQDYFSLKTGKVYKKGFAGLHSVRLTGSSINFGYLKLAANYSKTVNKKRSKNSHLAWISKMTYFKL